MRLQRDGPHQTADVGHVHRLLDLPAGEVGQANVVDLAGAHGGIEERQGLFDRGVRVPGVHLVQIDRVDPQAAQAGVEGPGEVTSGQPDLIGTRTGREASLRRQHDVIANLWQPFGQPTTDDLLRAAVAVHVRSVDQVAADLDEPVELGVGGLLVGLGPERHRSERQRRHADTTRSQNAVLHHDLPLLLVAAVKVLLQALHLRAAGIGPVHDYDGPSCATRSSPVALKCLADGGPVGGLRGLARVPERCA